MGGSRGCRLYDHSCLRSLDRQLPVQGFSLFKLWMRGRTRVRSNFKPGTAAKLPHIPVRVFRGQHNERLRHRHLSKHHSHPPRAVYVYVHGPGIEHPLGLSRQPLLLGKCNRLIRRSMVPQRGRLGLQRQDQHHHQRDPSLHVHVYLDRPTDDDNRRQLQPSTTIMAEQRA